LLRLKLTDSDDASLRDSSNQSSASSGTRLPVTLVVLLERIVPNGDAEYIESFKSPSTPTITGGGVGAGGVTGVPVRTSVDRR